jgi:hypothetical protein
VADNQSVEASLGGYLRPIREDGRELKTGVNVRYMSFDENLSKFTYGHGGYFSPQDYVSLSFPIEYSEDYRRWTWSATFAPGFQSYRITVCRRGSSWAPGWVTTPSATTRKPRRR